MASKRSHSKPKTESMTLAPARVQRLAFFGPPPLLEGEDAALYDDLVGRMCAAVKPVDIIDELYIADLVTLEWDIMRGRRLKFSQLQRDRAKRGGRVLKRSARFRGVRGRLCGSSCGNSYGSSSGISSEKSSGRGERPSEPVRPVATGRCEEGQGASRCCQTGRGADTGRNKGLKGGRACPRVCAARTRGYQAGERASGFERPDHPRPHVPGFQRKRLR